MRSTQEDDLSEAGAALESLPRMKTEVEASKSFLTKTSSTETGLSENVSEIQSWEDRGPKTWSATALVSEAWAAKAEAWETQAWKIQSRNSHPKQISALEMKPALDQNEEPSPEKVQVTEKEQDEVLPTRPFWSNKINYILAQVGYSLRPVTVWNFPHLWLHDGGSSFFIPYIIMLFLIGIPLLFLEMAVGQGLHQDSLGVWKVFSPWLGGIGYASFMVRSPRLPTPTLYTSPPSLPLSWKRSHIFPYVGHISPVPQSSVNSHPLFQCPPLLLSHLLPGPQVCFIVGLYFNVMNSWSLFYLGESFQFPVPWEQCPLLKNSSGFDPECLRTTPFMYFWYQRTLEASDSIDDGGPPVFHLSLSLLLSWCLVVSIMINGLKSTGKAMYVLVLFPYFINFGFLIRSLLLEGALFGLQHMVYAKISALYSIKVWHQAGIQVLFSLGLGFGAITAFSSYMPQSNNCLSDAFVVALANLGFVMLTAPALFSVMGFWATVTIHRCHEKNAEILIKLVAQGELPPEARPPVSLHDNPTAIFTTWLSGLPQPIRNMVLSKVSECDIEKQILKIKEGPSFAFLAFTEAMSLVPGSDIWSIFFFLLLTILGLSNMIGIVQGIITPLQDTFSTLRKHTRLLIVCVSVFMYLGGLFFIRPSGVYFIKLLNDYWIVLPIIIIIIFENTAMAWVYRARRFLGDLKIMLGHPISPIYRWLWCYLSPFVLLVLFVTSVIHLCLNNITYVAWDSSTSKEVIQQYPPWTLILMAILFVIVILPIPTYCIYHYIHGSPVSPTSSDRSILFKSLSLSDHVTPITKVQNEEILQSDKTNC